jgi:hypothetical protein
MLLRLSLVVHVEAPPGTQGGTAAACVAGVVPTTRNNHPGGSMPSTKHDFLWREG